MTIQHNDWHPADIIAALRKKGTFISITSAVGPEPPVRLSSARCHNSVRSSRD
ncbi:transcriptional regulator [Affinibrenneria salicis]|uniref:Transcriptional regulator n=1 Tax=Affinibrenneria salicis TaxID=2590031 RepID=A0A5J5G518_9GAMM|nr:helix-turn-helix domain-containing protein [Affinibrenneria salicis]KAA9002070.1 transcriptional regulator [Affinibrenneria salicis]